MTDRLNKTSLCSVVFLDIIDYSKKPVSEQIDDKSLFNALVSEAIKNVAQNDRIILDTGDGAAITLMGAPEEALFVALTIRDGILEHNKKGHQPLFVRIGINLGSVRVVKDINDRPNIIGDGINVAQRIMSFAAENQILVSRSYYEVTSRLTKEITGMFAYSGIKQDKHVREHEVYLIKPRDNAEAEISKVATSKVDTSAVKVVSNMTSETTLNKAAMPSLLTIKSDYIIYLVATFVLVGLLFWYFLALKPAPQSASELDELKESSPISYPVELKKQDLPQPVTQDGANTKSAKEASNKPAEKKTLIKDTQVKRERQPQQSEPRKAESRNSNSESARKVEAPKCSQAQIAMNQCR